MRRRSAVILAALVVCAAPSAARAQNGNASVTGFGGLTFGTSSVIGGAATASTFGGTVAAGLTDHIQIVGEAGRMSDIKPPLLGLLDFTPIDLHVRAWYGEGGVRFIASPRSAVRPYAEATAGFARLSTGVAGFGARPDAIIDTSLALLNRTEPLLGVGGGVMLQGGPLSVDVGYRYKKIKASGVSALLNAGNDYQVNQVRVGVGIRF